MPFTKIDRAAGRGYEDFVWLHDSAPVWVVYYPATHVRREFWQAYRSINKVPRGRAPWTIDNRRIGTDDGFASLDAAMDAGEHWLRQAA